MKLEPTDFELETTSIWSFPNRGCWATHAGIYRGNWSPYVPRNLILRYSKPKDWILDQFVGSGTTMIEAKLLDRNAIGIDINQNALLLAEKNISFKSKTNPKMRIIKGNAADMYFIKNQSIDFICTHPPYANIIKYSDATDGDISLLNVKDFLSAMNKVAKESFRVLKNGKMCAVMIGDIRMHGKVAPLGFHVMECFLKEGFSNREIIIKEQHNCRSTEFWTKQNQDFILLAHEYIFVFQK